MTSDNNNVIKVQFGPKHPLPLPKEPDSSKISAEILRNGEKKEIFEKFLDGNATTMLVFDATQPDVRVPEMFRQEKDLRLNFCLEFRIPEFCVDKQGVRGSLSFPEGFAFCDVPWNHVFIIRNVESGETYTWKEDIPKEKPTTKKTTRAPKLQLLTLDD